MQDPFFIVLCSKSIWNHINLISSMKRLFTLLLAGMLALPVLAQQKRKIATVDQKTQQVSMEDRIHQVMYSAEPTLVQSHPYTPQVSGQRTGGINAVAPVQLGRASNIFSVLRGEQNQVYADNDLGVVAFIHRHDVTVWGGGSAENGKMRFDVSVDGGVSFTADIDVLNATYTRPARYPNLTGFNPNNETNPFNSFLAYSAPTLNGSPDWDGHVTGVVPVTTSPPGNATENYALLSSQSYLQGGLTEGLPGEFWTTELQYDGSGFPGDIYVNKGTYNSSTTDIDWVRKDTVSPPHYTGFDGTATVVGGNIAFDPSGNTGWLVWLGDLQGSGGGGDSVLVPCAIKSTDGGATWGTPIEVDLNANQAVADWLTAFWIQVDSVTGDTTPVSSGRATCAFDYDITVDVNGNPHIAVVIGSGSTSDAPAPAGYTIFSGIEKFMADVTTDDGGASWYVNYVAPVLAFRGSFGNTNPVTMDNQPQISRTPSGDHVFYSWVDSDTSAATGSMNGIGFGVSDQLAPNLRTAGRRISDGAQTCYKRVTDGDFIWEGRALYPSLAPEVIIDNGMVKLPIVMTEMITNEPLESCNFWYFGNDSAFNPANGSAGGDFWPANQLVLDWDAPSCVDSTIVSVDNVINENIVLGQSYPNPTNGETAIGFELPFASDISLDVTNIYGQQVAVIAEGEYPAGTHKVVFNTKDLAAGTYMYNLRTNGTVQTKKLVVSK